MHAMNVETRGMRTAVAMAGVTLVAAALWSMTGCGGSGSSGFDISEAQTIAHAIDDQDCIGFEQQTFCASGVTPDEGAFQGAAVIIEAPPEPLVCDDTEAPDQPCTASLDFVTVGFRVPNSLLAAVAESEMGPWTQVPLTVTEEDPTGPRTVTITVPGTHAQRSKPLIAAVLVYEGEAPGSVPRKAQHLRDFGVDLVYVSPRLEVVVPR
jgi:hypothetical protein